MKFLKILIPSLLITFINVHAQWGTTVAENKVINEFTNSINSTSVSDGKGGLYIAWLDNRNDSKNYDVYAQHIDASGALLWVNGGIIISNNPHNEGALTMIGDGEGGAILVWRDAYLSNLNAQRINSSGIIWQPNGISVCAADGHQFNQNLISDGNGGAFIVWEDGRNFLSDYDIYAQRINNLGENYWQTNGIRVCNASRNQTNPYILSDNNGGVFITWRDERINFDYTFYGQRLSSKGEQIWADNGIILAKSYFAGFMSKPVSDGGKGFIMAYGTYNGVMAQKINEEGTALWDSAGMKIISNNFGTIKIISDNKGGAVFAWTEERFAKNYKDLFTQRINSEGQTQWTENGVLLCDALWPQYISNILVDNLGGYIYMWYDDRNTMGYSSQLYAQRLDDNGSIQWAKNGTLLTQAAGVSSANLRSSNELTGYIATWCSPMLSSKSNGVYAQNICSQGNLGVCTLDNQTFIGNNKTIIYPNPAKGGIINIKPIQSFNDAKILITSMNGQILLEKNALNGENISLNLNNLSSGIYSISIIDHGKIEIQKLIIE